MLIISLLYGCTSPNNNSPVTDTKVYQGTGGLDIEFLKDSPPNEVYEQETFQVVAMLKNKGAYEIKNGQIVLTYEKDYIASNIDKINFALDGKTIYTPQDDEKINSFYLNTKEIPAMSQTFSSIILLTACYDYATILQTEVCIDTDPHETKTIEKACKSESRSFSGQGSPIEVERVEPKMISTQNGILPQFKIYLQNSGDGEVISKNKINEICGFGNIEKSDINGVTLKEIRFSKYSKKNDDISCLPQFIKLVDGQDYFVCTLNEDKVIDSETSTFLTDLYLEFDYGYTITKSKEFSIKKLNS